MICSQDVKSCDFLELCVNNGLTQLVNEPPRLNNILDLVLCNNEIVISELTINEPFGTSDHDSINFVVVIENEFSVLDDPKNNIGIDLCKLWWKADWEGFELYCLSIDWFEILSGCFEANEMWGCFINVLNEGINTFVPQRKWTKTSTKIVRYPIALRKLINKKRRL